MSLRIFPCSRSGRPAILSRTWPTGQKSVRLTYESFDRFGKCPEFDGTPGIPVESVVRPARRSRKDILIMLFRQTESESESTKPPFERYPIWNGPTIGQERFLDPKDFFPQELQLSVEPGFFLTSCGTGNHDREKPSQWTIATPVHIFGIHDLFPCLSLEKGGSVSDRTGNPSRYDDSPRLRTLSRTGLFLPDGFHRGKPCGPDGRRESEDDTDDDRECRTEQERLRRQDE